MAKIADISTKLSLNNRDFKKGLQSTSKSLGKFHAAFKRAAGRIAKAGVVALAAVGVAMVAIVKKTASKIDELSKEARKLDITTEMLAGLGHAAKLSGLDQEKLSKSLVKMTKAVSEANEGLSTQVRAFDDLGLEVGDLMKMDAGQQFLTIADAFGNIENHSTKVRVAMDVFGRTGGDLLVTMEQGAEGIRKAIDEAKHLGITFSEEQGAMVEEANDSMTKLASIGEGAFNQLTIASAPFVSNWSDAMTEAALEGENMTVRVTAGLGKIVKGIGVLGNAANLVKGVIQFSFGGIQLVIGKTLQGINESLIWTFGKIDLALRGAAKLPFAEKLGIPAGLNPDLTHEQVMDELRGAPSTEYIAQMLLDARANVAAGKVALKAGAGGFFAERLMSDYRETVDKAMARGVQMAGERLEKRIGAGTGIGPMTEEQLAKADPVAWAAGKVSEKAQEQIKTLLKKAGLRWDDPVAGKPRIVKEVVKVGEDIKKVVEDIIDVVQPLARKGRFMKFEGQAGPNLLGKKPRGMFGGFEVVLPPGRWEEVIGEKQLREAAAKADIQLLEEQLAEGRKEDMQKGKAAAAEVQKDKTLIAILTAVQQIRDSKFVAFAS